MAFTRKIIDLNIQKLEKKNSVVSLHIYELESGETKEVKIGSEKDVYLARMQWLPKGQVLSVIRLNRLQNTMDIFHHNCEASETKLIYTEKSDTYIDIDQVDDLTYLENDQSFIISSETSGFKHLYH
jgi:dipeptidyl-peptidase-4